MVMNYRKEIKNREIHQNPEEVMVDDQIIIR